MTASIETTVKKEIEDLHRFFVEWFSGVIPVAGFDAGFYSRFDPDFRLIPPSGSILTLGEIGTGIRNAYGTNPDFRIAIRNIKIHRVLDRYILATYEEWQRNALASTPPDNARVATVLFENSVPLRWLHIHETWMPASAVAADSFDF
jgi:hypothetical protein